MQKDVSKTSLKLDVTEKGTLNMSSIYSGNFPLKYTTMLISSKGVLFNWKNNHRVCIHLEMETHIGKLLIITKKCAGCTIFHQSI